MEWFKALLAMLGLKKLEHPLFGKMGFIKTPDSANSYWEGDAIFSPTGKRVEVFVDGNATGLHEGAEDFYRQVESRYTELISIVRPLLAAEFEQFAGRELGERVEDEFTLSSFSITDQRTQPIEWEVSFDSASNDHLFSVQLTDWKPTTISVDG